MKADFLPVYGHPWHGFLMLSQCSSAFHAWGVLMRFAARAQGTHALEVRSMGLGEQEWFRGDVI